MSELSWTDNKKRPSRRKSMNQDLTRNKPNSGRETLNSNHFFTRYFENEK